MKNGKSSTVRHKAASVTVQNHDVSLLIERLKRGGHKNETLKKSYIISKLRNKYNVPIYEIVQLSNYKKAQVYNLSKISEMPAKVKVYIKEGRINPTDACSLSRNQPTEKAFIETVKSFIKKSDKNHNHHVALDANIMRKEQMFAGRPSVKNSELTNQLGKLLKEFSLKRISAAKLRMATNVVSQLIQA